MEFFLVWILAGMVLSGAWLLFARLMDRRIDYSDFEDRNNNRW